MYSIDNGVTWYGDPIFPNLTPGTYQVAVAVSGDERCVIRRTATVSGVSSINISSVTTTAATTCSASNGKITVNATGGSTLYYKIQGGQWQTSKNITGLVPGSYNVFVKNGDGSCERAYASNPVQVAGAGSIVINTVNIVAPTNCDTLTANGQITINATGGTGLKYSINGGTTFVTTNVFSNLRAGTYNIVVSKSDGSCPVSYQPVVLATPSGITISNVATTKPTVCGLSNGAITITVTPSGTYQYSINGGQTFQSSATFSNLMQGNYSIVVKSTTTGCTAYHATNPLVLSPQSCPEICNDGFDNNNNGQIDDCPDATCTLTPIQVQVTQTNCQTNAKGIININTAHVYKTCSSLNAGAIKFTYYDKSSGAFQFSFVPLVNIAGGTSLIFTDKGWVNSTIGFWSGEGIIQWTAPTAGILAGTKVDIVGVEVFGSYFVSTTTGIVKKDNNVPNAAAYGSNLNFNLTGSGDQIIALCGTSFATGDLGNLVFLAAINANATTWNAGGATTDKTSAIPPGLTNGTTAVAVGNTSYWSTTAPTIDNTISYSINGGETFQASGTFSNLNPGFYKVVVKKGTCLTAYSSNLVQIYGCSELCNDGIDNDGNGKADCMDVACSVGSVAVVPVAPACPPADTFGKITINLSITGGASYQYSINNGAAWQAGTTFNNLNPGNYNVKVKRNNTGCETAFTNNPVVLTTPVCTEICDDGYDNDKDGAIDCDDADCGVASSAYEIRTVAPICPANAANGKITISRKFLNGPVYLYSKDGGLTFQSDTTFANLLPGTYQIAIKNQSTGCVVLYAGNPVVFISPTCPEICNNTIDDDGDGLADCADTDCGVPSYAVEFIRPDCPPNDVTGSITVIPYGAIADYRYRKDNGAPWQNAPTFTNVVEGDYQIAVKRQSSGCTLTYAGNPLQLRRVPCQEICGDNLDNDLDGLVDCLDTLNCGVTSFTIDTVQPAFVPTLVKGSITVTPPDSRIYEYSIDGGITYQANATFNNLEAGEYNVFIKCNGCDKAYDYNPILLRNPTEVCNNGQDDDGDGLVDCDDSDCTIETICAGTEGENNITFTTIEICKGQEAEIGKNVNPNYCFSWEPKEGLSNSDLSVTQTRPDKTKYYVLNITDDSGEVVERNIYKIKVNIEKLTISPANPTVCSSQPITLTVVEDTYTTYKWKNEQENEIGSGRFLMVAYPGIYKVTAVKSNGCVAEGKVEVKPEIELSLNGGLLCSIGEETITLNAGEGFSTYQWSPTMQITSSIEVNQAGTYSVTVTNARGCQASASTKVLDAYDPLAVLEFFNGRGFESTTIDITGQDPTLQKPDNSKLEKRDEAITIHDYANLIINLDGQTVDLDADLNQIFLDAISEGTYTSAEVFITKNECENFTYESVEQAFLSSTKDAVLWIHLWENPDENGKDLLLYKFGGIVEFWTKNCDDDPLENSDEWEPLTYDALADFLGDPLWTSIRLKYPTESVESINRRFSFELGNRFEDAVIASSGVTPHDKPVPFCQDMGIEREPDGIHPILIPGWRYFPYGVFVDAKTTNSELITYYQSGQSRNQIPEYIRCLGDSPMAQFKYITPILWFITPYGTELEQRILDEAELANVTVLHSKVYYSVDDPYVIKVGKPCIKNDTEVYYDWRPFGGTGYSPLLRLFRLGIIGRQLIDLDQP